MVTHGNGNTGDVCREYSITYFLDVQEMHHDENDVGLKTVSVIRFSEWCISLYITIKSLVLWFYPTAQTCRSQEKQQNVLKSAISKSAFRTHFKSPILTLFWPSKRNTATEEQKVFGFLKGWILLV